MSNLLGQQMSKEQLQAMFNQLSSGEEEIDVQNLIDSFGLPEQQSNNFLSRFLDLGVDPVQKQANFEQFCAFFESFASGN